MLCNTMNKTTITYLNTELFFIFVLFMIIYILLEVFIPNKTTDILGYKSYVVVTTSMEPDIMVNDMIIIHKVKEEKLQVRDAITFTTYIPELGYKSEVTHYIGDIQTIDGNIIYKTQGATKDFGDYDIWKNADNEIIEIAYEDIEGRVILTIPYLGHAVNIVKDPILVGSVVINIIIIYALVNLIRKPKEEEK